MDEHLTCFAAIAASTILPLLNNSSPTPPNIGLYANSKCYSIQTLNLSKCSYLNSLLANQKIAAVKI